MKKNAIPELEPGIKLLVFIHSAPSDEELREQLRRRLDQWMQDTGDPLLKGLNSRPFSTAN